MLLPIEFLECLGRDANRAAPSELDKREIASRDHPPNRLFAQAQVGCNFSHAEHSRVVNGAHVFVSIGA